jgi:uncharacterized membrane protein
MKKSYALILFLIVIYTAGAEINSFTISAVVERSAVVNLDKEFISAYIKNLEIYPKFFPNVLSVNKLGDKRSQWLYTVEAPLASPYNLTFELEDKSNSNDTLLFESEKGAKDYLYCNAILSNLTEKKTRINFVFKIIMTREKASDIHFLAGVLGEKFLSDKMKEKLESDLETFISKATKDMYIESRNAGNY